jgi:hypothetical protein
MMAPGDTIVPAVIAIAMAAPSPKAEAANRLAGFSSAID